MATDLNTAWRVANHTTLIYTHLRPRMVFSLRELR